MNLLAKTLAGSRLYGLDNPSSDTDEKGIFLPSIDDCLLDRAPTTQSEKKPGYEYEGFSLQRFLQLAARAEDVAMVILHSNRVLVDSPLYQMLRANRSRFYTKRMAGSLGFATSQSAKYALRADRMQTVEAVIKVLEAFEDKGIGRLGQVWEELPELPYTRRYLNETDRGLDKRAYDVVGKTLPATITPTYALDILIKVRDTYGDRVRAARNMGNADLKSISHAFRVGYQLKHIYQDGDFSFPLPESLFIRDVKEGRANYVTDHLDDRLNELITEVEALAAASSYPESVDRKWLDGIIIEAYSSEMAPRLVEKLFHRL